MYYEELLEGLEPNARWALYTDRAAFDLAHAATVHATGRGLWTHMTSKQRNVRISRCFSAGAVPGSNEVELIGLSSYARLVRLYCPRLFELSALSWQQLVTPLAWSSLTQLQRNIYINHTFTAR